MIIPKDLILLIDADTLVYRAGFAAEKVEYCIPPGDTGKCHYFSSHKEAKAYCDANELSKLSIWNRRIIESEEVAIKNLKNIIQGITGTLCLEDVFKGEFYLTGPTNFRNYIAVQKEYKGNRVQLKPKHYKALRSYLIDKCGAKVSHDQEADDELGIEADKYPDGKVVIVSNDKDLDQVVGYHYNWVTKEQYYIDDEQAIRLFYKQLLMGDAVDNIPGVLTESAATKMVGSGASAHELAVLAEAVYRETYEDKWEDHLEEIADLVYIRKETSQQGGNCQGKHQFWSDFNGT